MPFETGEIDEGRGTYPHPFIGERRDITRVDKEINKLRKYAEENAIKSIDELKPTLEWRKGANNFEKTKAYLDKTYGTLLRTKDAIYYFDETISGGDIVIKLDLIK